MNEWLDDLADGLGVPRMTNEEIGALLKLTREVAHTTERRFAPLAAFLIGAAAGRASGEDAFGAAIAAGRGLLPPVAATGPPAG
jgi:hypothetical protein